MVLGILAWSSVLNKVFFCNQKHFLVDIKRFEICDCPVQPVINVTKAKMFIYI